MLNLLLQLRANNYAFFNETTILNSQRNLKFPVKEQNINLQTLLNFTSTGAKLNCFKITNLGELLMGFLMK